ncbi:MAG: helix-turn-helix domain-containing protein [Clostridia bacterium]
MFLKRLKDIREDNDLLQKQVAMALGITRQQYSLYETGERSLPIDKLYMLAKFYNTSADYILGLTDEINPYPKSK